ncbi:hypothetical protein RCRUDOLPH_15 [Rhodobacter phage RcRudolph]|nr:hypothetical protein RCRUDOLPH_15 [Rhodobacter phage RcRudolph]
MAIAVYAVTRSPRGGDQLVNDIEGMILAIDDAVDTSAALIRARAVTVANANGQALPPGYFDVATNITAFNVAAECIIFGDVKVSAVS